MRDKFGFVKKKSKLINKKIKKPSLRGYFAISSSIFSKFSYDVGQSFPS